MAKELKAIILDTQSDDEAEPTDKANVEIRTETEADPVDQTEAETRTETFTKSPINPNTQNHENNNNNNNNNNNQDYQAQVQATLATAHTIVQTHIRLLHDYNAIKDIGQGLFGLIADSRGLRLREIHEEFGVDDSD